MTFFFLSHHSWLLFIPFTQRLYSQEKRRAPSPLVSPNMSRPSPGESQALTSSLPMVVVVDHAEVSGDHTTDVALASTHDIERLHANYSAPGSEEPQPHDLPHVYRALQAQPTVEVSVQTGECSGSPATEAAASSSSPSAGVDSPSPEHEMVEASVQTDVTPPAMQASAPLSTSNPKDLTYHEGRPYKPRAATCVVGDGITIKLPFAADLREPDNNLLHVVGNPASDHDHHCSR